MILSSKENALTYRCPICGAHVISMMGVFGLSGDMIKLKCTCGGSQLTIKKEKEGKLSLSIPCLFCEEEHQYTLDRKRFFTNRALTLTCQITGLAVCCIGSEDAVKEYAAEQDEKLDQILKECGFESLESYLTQAAANRLNQAGGDDEYDEEEEILIDEGEVIAAADFILADLEEAGQIHCACKETEQDIAYCYQDGVLQVFCRKCGSEAELEMRTGGDLHAFYDCDALELEKIAVLDFDSIPEAKEDDED